MFVCLVGHGEGLVKRTGSLSSVVGREKIMSNYKQLK